MKKVKFYFVATSVAAMAAFSACNKDNSVKPVNGTNVQLKSATSGGQQPPVGSKVKRTKVLKSDELSAVSDTSGGQQPPVGSKVVKRLKLVRILAVSDTSGGQQPPVGSK